MSTSSNRNRSLDVPQVEVNNHRRGSLCSLTSSEKGYSPNTSPRNGRKVSGFKKMIPWKKRSLVSLNANNAEETNENQSYEHNNKARMSMEGKSRKLETRKKRSRSVDHLLIDSHLTPDFDLPSKTGHNLSSVENEARLHSPARSSVTDEESFDGESVSETCDVVDGVENTERLNEESQRLKQKIEKTKERMKKLQCCMDENLEEYLQSVKDKPDPELGKKAFEKRNFKSKANIGQLQKKLDKHQKALKELENRQQRARTSHSAKEVLRGVKTSVKELSGGVRDGVKAISGKGFSGAVSKFFNSSESITDALTLSKSDSECHDITHGEDSEQYGGYERGKARTPSPKNVLSEEDNFSLTSGNQISVATSSPRYSEAADALDVKLKDIVDAQITLKQTVDKALSDINAIATSLQEERYKTQRLECQFNELRSHWNDFSELHQNEIMVLRQEMERADERIETVDYRVVERVAEIDESFDTFDARISKIENLHHQQGITVDDYLEQNTQAKAVLTKFLSVVLAILTLLFSIFTLVVQSIAPVTRTKMRLLVTVVLVAFLALWLNNPDHHLVIRTRRKILEPSYELFRLLRENLANYKGEHNSHGNNDEGTNTRETYTRRTDANMT